MRRLMKTHLLLFLLFIGFSSFGQLSIDPNPVSLITDASIADAKVDFHIRNDGTEAVELWWRLQPIDAPTRWEYQICDCNLCYLPGLLAAPCSQSCTIEPGGDFIFMIHVLPNEEVGQGMLNLQILANCDDTTAILDVPIDVAVESTTSTENTAIANNLSLYPNPAYDGFKITNDEDVTQIVVFNILGKQIQSEKHFPGKTHDISSLERGYYLIRIVDKYQNDKVLRLTKK